MFPTHCKQPHDPNYRNYTITQSQLISMSLYFALIKSNPLKFHILRITRQTAFKNPPVLSGVFFYTVMLQWFFLELLYWTLSEISMFSPVIVSSLKCVTMCHYSSIYCLLTRSAIAWHACCIAASYRCGEEWSFSPLIISACALRKAVGHDRFLMLLIKQKYYVWGAWQAKLL